jgi:hypothetical protein
MLMNLYVQTSSSDRPRDQSRYNRRTFGVNTITQFWEEAVSCTFCNEVLLFQIEFSKKKPEKNK